jgi:hypothetical protein
MVSSGLRAVAAMLIEVGVWTSKGHSLILPERLDNGSGCFVQVGPLDVFRI